MGGASTGGMACGGCYCKLISAEKKSAPIISCLSPLGSHRAILGSGRVCKRNDDWLMTSAEAPALVQFRRSQRNFGKATHVTRPAFSFSLSLSFSRFVAIAEKSRAAGISQT